MAQFTFNLILVVAFFPMIAAGLVLIADSLLDWGE